MCGGNHYRFDAIEGINHHNVLKKFNSRAEKQIEINKND